MSVPYSNMFNNNPFVTNQVYDNPYRYYTPNRFDNYQRMSEPPRVRGAEGAKAFPFGVPNGSILLLDDTNPIVWLRMNNELGHPSVFGYSITPLVAENPEPQREEPVDNASDGQYEQLEQRLSELERRMKSNGKSDSSGNGRNSDSGNQQRSGSKSQ